MKMNQWKSINLTEFHAYRYSQQRYSIAVFYFWYNYRRVTLKSKMSLLTFRLKDTPFWLATCWVNLSAKRETLVWHRMQGRKKLCQMCIRFEFYVLVFQLWIHGWHFVNHLNHNANERSFSFLLNHRQYKVDSISVCIYFTWLFILTGSSSVLAETWNSLKWYPLCTSNKRAAQY